mmetsp:Transcript_36898/g.106395  ORF Transcript_36898/g.106395 Transcript_36898/m.106395 type:complete len:225 (+) Transcript_36898:1473-2147(+)
MPDLRRLRSSVSCPFKVRDMQSCTKDSWERALRAAMSWELTARERISQSSVARCNSATGWAPASEDSALPLRRPRKASSQQWKRGDAVAEARLSGESLGVKPTPISHLSCPQGAAHGDCDSKPGEQKPRFSPSSDSASRKSRSHTHTASETSSKVSPNPSSRGTICITSCQYWGSWEPSLILPSNASRSWDEILCCGSSCCRQSSSTPPRKRCMPQSTSSAPSS